MVLLISCCICHQLKCLLKRTERLDHPLVSKGRAVVKGKCVKRGAPYSLEIPMVSTTSQATNPMFNWLESKLVQEQVIILYFLPPFHLKT